MKIGIDIGNVIIGGEGEDTTFFTDQYLNTPEVEGAFNSLFNLWENSSVKEIHYISKAGIGTENKTMLWFDWHGFTRPIAPPQRVHFVRKRHLKAPMAQALELDIFIDDRQDVLDHMIGVVKHLILFKSWEQANRELEEIFQELT